MTSDARHGIGVYLCSRYSCGNLSSVDTEMGGMCAEHASPLMFSLQLAGYEGHGLPSLVPWEKVKPHWRQALLNHGRQTLARLSERGGLFPEELLAVMEGRSVSDILSKAEVAARLGEKLGSASPGSREASGVLCALDLENLLSADPLLAGKIAAAVLGAGHSVVIVASSPTMLSDTALRELPVVYVGPLDKRLATRAAGYDFRVWIG